jgi:HEAT repeat protein
LEQLERIAQRPEAIVAADFTPLLALLRQENYYSERVLRLTRLALVAARAGSAEPNPEIPFELARDLAVALSERFGDQAAAALVEVSSAAGRSFARALAKDPQPLLRSISARALAHEPDADDARTLIGLLDDEDRAVEAAAIEALGDNQIEDARTELIVRAKLGVAPVRAAALRAIGKLRGAYVLDALILGIGDAEPTVRIAAAEGLAALGDPAATSILISMLGNPHDAGLYEAARQGLRELGQAAVPDLLRAAQQPGNKGRREATLFLSEQGIPEAASLLMTMLSGGAHDARVTNELAILTGLDLRTSPDPAAAWWSWWDGVRHDDSLAWFFAALERVNVPTPAPSALTGSGSAQGRSFLLGVMERPEDHLVERARREFARLVGRDPGALPPRGPDRDRWLRELRESTGTRDP